MHTGYGYIYVLWNPIVCYNSSFLIRLHLVTKTSKKIASKWCPVSLDQWATVCNHRGKSTAYILRASFTVLSLSSWVFRAVIQVVWEHNHFVKWLPSNLVIIAADCMPCSEANLASSVPILFIHWTCIAILAVDDRVTPCDIAKYLNGRCGDFLPITWVPMWQTSYKKVLESLEKEACWRFRWFQVNLCLLMILSCTWLKLFGLNFYFQVNSR